MSNEIDPASSTGQHLIVKVLEETKDWYVTGWAWDHVVKEWVELDFKVIDKARAPQYVTMIKCPANYEPKAYDMKSTGDYNEAYELSRENKPEKDTSTSPYEAN